MKRTDIPNMTAEECADELTLAEIKKLIQRARKAALKAEECQKAVFRALEDMCIDLSTPINAENAYNLEEAVTCYLQCGEYDLSGVMREIRKQYCGMVKLIEEGG